MVAPGARGVGPRIEIMAPKRRSGLSSPFDDMLEENRRELEELYGSSGRAHRPRPDRRSLPPLERDPEPNPSVPQATPTGVEAPPEVLLVEAAETLRFLKDRYQDGWRYEVRERRRDGDEVIVLCRLAIDAQNISKAQFGSARLGPSEASRNVSGSADGVAFTVRYDNGGGNSLGADAEEDAYRRAVADALAKCAALL